MKCIRIFFVMQTCVPFKKLAVILLYCVALVKCILFFVMQTCLRSNRVTILVEPFQKSTYAKCIFIRRTSCILSDDVFCVCKLHVVSSLMSKCMAVLTCDAYQNDNLFYLFFVRKLLSFVSLFVRVACQ